MISEKLNCLAENDLFWPFDHNILIQKITKNTFKNEFKRIKIELRTKIPNQILFKLLVLGELDKIII